MAVKYTQTYKTYEDAAAEARRAQAMAEMLQQQAYQPIQMDNAAPMSYTQGLAKVLQSYLAGKEARKAREAGQQAEQKVAEAGGQITGRLMGGFTPDASQVAKTDMGYEARPSQVPEQTSLEEVTRTSQYKQSPEDALRVAMTPAGGAAMQRNPLLAQMLSQYAGPKTPEEFYQPTETAGGQLVQFGKRGGRRDTGLTAATKTENIPSAVREYEYARGQGYTGSFTDWNKEQKRAGATNLSVDTKGSQLGAEYFLKELSDQHKTAKGSQGVLDKLDRMEAATKSGTFTGGTAPGAMAATQWLSGFGVNVAPTTLANSRTFEAAKDQLVLDFMAANGGARGFTEKESEILNKSFPQIVDNPAARKAISDVIRAKAKRDVSNYNSSLSDFNTTYPTARIPYKPMSVETKEDRYQRWLQSQGGAR